MKLHVTSDGRPLGHCAIRDGKAAFVAPESGGRAQLEELFDHYATQLVAHNPRATAADVLRHMAGRMTGRTSAHLDDAP